MVIDPEGWTRQIAEEGRGMFYILILVIYLFG